VKNSIISSGVAILLLATFLVILPGCGPKSSTNSIVGFMGARQGDSDYSFFVTNTDINIQTRLAPALILAPFSSEVWAPDRTKLAYLDSDFPTHKYWFSLVDTNGANQHKVIDLTDSSPTSWSWTADGKNLIMWCITGAQATDIFTMDINSGELKRLTDTSNIGKSSPLGSPDGKKIAFSGGEFEPVTRKVISYGIYIITTNGTGEARSLSSPNLIRSFQWSPNSKKIVYCSQDGQKGLNSADICVLDVATGTTVNLTNNPETGDLDPVWSPDGKKIAFCSGTIGQIYHLQVMNADGTGVTSLYDFPDYPKGFPSWSPDGKTILFTDRQIVYSVGTDGKNLRTLLDGKGIFRDIQYPVWLSK